MLVCLYALRGFTRPSYISGGGGGEENSLEHCHFFVLFLSFFVLFLSFFCPFFVSFVVIFCRFFVLLLSFLCRFFVSFGVMFLSWAVPLSFSVSLPFPDSCAALPPAYPTAYLPRPLARASRLAAQTVDSVDDRELLSGLYQFAHCVRNVC